MRGVRTAVAATLLLAATGCAEGSDPATTSPATRAPLDWRPTGHSVGERVVVGERWTAVASGRTVRFESSTGAADVTLPPVSSAEVDAVLLAGDTAVVSYAYDGETMAGTGHRIDLTSGEPAEIVNPEPANGGDWSMVDDSLYYPALGEDQRVCLATLAVADGNGEEGWCPDGRVGIAELEANEHGVGAMLFGHTGDVSCRTLTLLDQAGVPQPVAGPADCVGWDVAATSTGTVWSEVPRPRRQEVAVFHARADGTTRRLGRGTTGSLTTCGGDAFFVSDPATPTDPARLLRWDGTTLSVAYESASTGNAFLGRPGCADGILTLSSFGEDGDEQVSASVS